MVRSPEVLEQVMFGLANLQITAGKHTVLKLI